MSLYLHLPIRIDGNNGTMRINLIADDGSRQTEFEAALTGGAGITPAELGQAIIDGIGAAP
jgi:hypothetical protein